MAELVRRPSQNALILGLAAGATTAAAGYVVYRFWWKDYLEETWRGVSGSATSAWRILESLGVASELSSTALSDLKAFLDSDADEVPRSVRQLLKLSRSPEFQQAVLCSTQSVTEGVARGIVRATEESQGQGQGQGLGGGRTQSGSKGVVEVVLEKLFTEEGKSFASAVCSRVVRTLVSSLRTPIPGDNTRGGHHSGGSSSPVHGPQTQEQQLHQQQQQQQEPPWGVVLVGALSTERGKELMTCIVQAFAVNCVGTFIEKTADVNMYHDMLEAASRHPELVKDFSTHVMTTMLREGIQTWQAGGTGGRPRPHVTQHGMRTGSSDTSSCGSSPRAGMIPMSTFSESDSEVPQHSCEPTSAATGSLVSASEVAQYLARPEIRSIILDVTGVMTMKGMEAFILVMFYKLFGGKQTTAVEIVDLEQDGREGSGRPASSMPPARLYASARRGHPTAVATRALAVASVCLAVLIHYASLC